MKGSTADNAISQTTTHKVVVPFYFYAAICFLVSTIILLVATSEFYTSYFHPKLLAIVHLMALGWGTMIILGASHQLIPVLIEAKLYSNKLAHASFVFAAIGIPLLVYSFYFFEMSLIGKWGGRCIIFSVIAFLINVHKSIRGSKKENIHAMFIFTATIWLLVTVCAGLFLLYNFTYNFFDFNSVDFLSLHAHVGIIGWFLLLIIGVGSRLIPMFLISKFKSNKQLWIIYFLINFGLILFTFLFLFIKINELYFLPLSFIFVGIIVFIHYCYNCFKQRIRKRIDEQMKVSLLAVLLMVVPIILLTVILSVIVFFSKENIDLIIVYGFVIFFGWITSIILGMTFKTLPFIIWNKIYHTKSVNQKSPSPKDLFNNIIFNWMTFFYLTGFFLFVISYLMSMLFIIQISICLLFIAALLYNWNVIKLLLHKSKY